LQNFATKCQNSEILPFWIGLKQTYCLEASSTATMWLGETYLIQRTFCLLYLQVRNNIRTVACRGGAKAPGIQRVKLKN